MDWMSIASALLLGTMLVLLFPRARRMLKESPEGSKDDWINVLVPLVVVIAFIWLLMQIV